MNSCNFPIITCSIYNDDIGPSLEGKKYGDFISNIFNKFIMS